MIGDNIFMIIFYNIQRVSREGKVIESRYVGYIIK